MAPLIAVVDTVLECLGREDLHLVIPTLVVAEATYFIGTRLGASAEGRFLAGLADLDVEAPALTLLP